MEAGRATGVPSVEAITPGLYGEQSDLFTWDLQVVIGNGKSTNAKTLQSPSSCPPPNFAC